IALNKMSTAQRQRIAGARGQPQKLTLQRLPAVLQSVAKFRGNQWLTLKPARYDDVQRNVPQRLNLAGLTDACEKIDSFRRCLGGAPAALPECTHSRQFRRLGARLRRKQRSKDLELVFVHSINEDDACHLLAVAMRIEAHQQTSE